MKLNKAELLDLASDMGLKGITDSNTKAEITAAILAAQEV